MIMEELFGVPIPIIQAPMAGVQGSGLAVAVCNAGGMGSLPCAMLSPEAISNEIAAIRAQTSKPFNVNFFCHNEPEPNPQQEGLWRAALALAPMMSGNLCRTCRAHPSRSADRRGK